ncbi:hypothetical protein MRX96_004037 [Rhipicephalus microplus]
MASPGSGDENTESMSVAAGVAAAAAACLLHTLARRRDRLLLFFLLNSATGATRPGALLANEPGDAGAVVGRRDAQDVACPWRQAGEQHKLTQRRRLRPTWRGPDSSRRPSTNRRNKQ